MLFVVVDATNVAVAVCWPSRSKSGGLSELVDDDDEEDVDAESDDEWE